MMDRWQSIALIKKYEFRELQFSRHDNFYSSNLIFYSLLYNSSCTILLRIISTVTSTEINLHVLKIVKESSIEFLNVSSFHPLNLDNSSIPIY